MKPTPQEYQRLQVVSLGKIARCLGRGMVRVSSGGCVHLLIDGGSLAQFGSTKNWRFFHPYPSLSQQRTTFTRIGEVYAYFKKERSMNDDLATAHAMWFHHLESEATVEETDEALALALYQAGVIGKDDKLAEVIYVEKTICIAMESGRMLELNSDGEITHDSHQRRPAR